jgi:hypothetical protein
MPCRPPPLRFHQPSPRNIVRPISLRPTWLLVADVPPCIQQLPPAVEFRAFPDAYVLTAMSSKLGHAAIHVQVLPFPSHPYTRHITSPSSSSFLLTYVVLTALAVTLVQMETITHPEEPPTRHRLPPLQHRRKAPPTSHALALIQPEPINGSDVDVVSGFGW